MKTGPQNDDGPPKQAVGVKRLSSLERLVDYGTDDEDMVEGPSPLHTAASFIAAPRSQEATTEDTREGETTTTANDSVVKRESPTNNGPKVCAPNGFSQLLVDMILVLKMGTYPLSSHPAYNCTSPSYQDTDWTEGVEGSGGGTYHSTFNIETA